MGEVMLHCRCGGGSRHIPETSAEAILKACGVIRAPNPVATIVHPAPELPGALSPLPCIWITQIRNHLTEETIMQKNRHDSTSSARAAGGAEVISSKRQALHVGDYLPMGQPCKHDKALCYDARLYMVRRLEASASVRQQGFIDMTSGCTGANRTRCRCRSKGFNHLLAGTTAQAPHRSGS